jgi:hypothetical protein
MVEMGFQGGLFPHLPGTWVQLAGITEGCPAIPLVMEPLHVVAWASSQHGSHRVARHSRLGWLSPIHVPRGSGRNCAASMAYSLRTQMTLLLAYSLGFIGLAKCSVGEPPQG